MPLGARRPVTLGGERTWRKFVAVGFESLVSVASVCFPLVRNTKVFCYPGDAAFHPFLVWSGIYTSSGGRRCTFSAVIRCLAGVLWKRIAAYASHFISRWVAKPRKGAGLPIHASRLFEVVWLITGIKCCERCVCVRSARIGEAVNPIVRIWITVRIFTL